MGGGGGVQIALKFNSRNQTWLNPNARNDYVNLKQNKIIIPTPLKVYFKSPLSTMTSTKIKLADTFSHTKCWGD